MYDSPWWVQYNGFHIHRGIRQGCPLSPLLFAVASDILLRRLDRAPPGACIRAYADDLAVSTQNALSMLNMMENLFNEYAAISGLHLNIPKTVFIPLHTYNEQTLRQAIHGAAPSWGGIGIKSAA